MMGSSVGLRWVARYLAGRPRATGAKAQWPLTPPLPPLALLSGFLLGSAVWRPVSQTLSGFGGSSAGERDDDPAADVDAAGGEGGTAGGEVVDVDGPGEDLVVGHR